jgi:hypothetical protein
MEHISRSDIWKALYRASETRGRYHHIFSSTIGVVFLGTPFQGSHESFYSATQLRIAVAITMNNEVSTGLVDYLDTDNHEREKLDEVVQLFCEMINKKQIEFPVLCFYETKTTNFTRVLEKLPRGYARKMKGAIGLVSLTHI